MLNSLSNTTRMLLFAPLIPGRDSGLERLTIMLQQTPVQFPVKCLGRGNWDVDLAVFKHACLKVPTTPLARELSAAIPTYMLQCFQRVRVSNLQTLLNPWALCAWLDPDTDFIVDQEPAHVRSVHSMAVWLLQDPTAVVFLRPRMAARYAWILSVVRVTRHKTTVDQVRAGPSRRRPRKA